MTGQILSMTRAEYDRVAGVNWSTLKAMRKSPQHYRHALLLQRPDTDAMKRGRAAHLAVFEPERFRSECAVWDGDARRGKDWDAFVKDNRGRELLTMDMWAEAKAIGQAARADKLAAQFLANGKSEQTLLWTHANGIQGKGRTDFLTTDALVDLKVTRDASPDAFGRQMVSLGTLCQCAYYSDAIMTITGRRLLTVLVAVEVAEPHAVGVYRLTDDQLEMGREAYLPLLDRLKECAANNSWPGYSEHIRDLVLPHWAIPQVDDDLSNVGLIFGGDS